MYFAVHKGTQVLTWLEQFSWCTSPDVSAPILRCDFIIPIVRHSGSHPPGVRPMSCILNSCHERLSAISIQVLGSAQLSPQQMDRLFGLREDFTKRCAELHRDRRRCHKVPLILISQATIACNRCD